MHDSGHRRSVVLAVDGVSPSSGFVSMRFIDTWALRVKLRENVRDIGGEPPRLFQEGVGITPRRSEFVLTAVEVGEEEVHLLH